MKLNMFYFVQSFSITKILLDNGGSCTSSSYLSHWVEFVEIYSQVTIFLSCKFSLVMHIYIECYQVMAFYPFLHSTYHTLYTSLYNFDAKALDNCVFLIRFWYLVLYIFSGCNFK